MATTTTTRQQLREIEARLIAKPWESITPIELQEWQRRRYLDRPAAVSAPWDEVRHIWMAAAAIRNLRALHAQRREALAGRESR